MNIKNGTTAVAAIAALAAFVFCVSRSSAIEAVYPVEHAKRTFADRVWARLAGIARSGETAAENVRLRREVATLAMVRGDCERLEEENRKLRAALGYIQKEPGGWIAARVLSEGGGAAGARRTLRVGKGSLAGVRAGAVVASPDGLVGRVSNVTPHTAEVLLAVDPALKVSCIVEGGRGTRGIVSGVSDDILVMRHFSEGSGFSQGARVFTSGMGGVFPGGIVVGTMRTACARSAGEMLRECEVTPAVDFSNLEDVFIRK